MATLIEPHTLFTDLAPSETLSNSLILLYGLGSYNTTVQVEGKGSVRHDTLGVIGTQIDTTGEIE